MARRCAALRGGALLIMISALLTGCSTNHRSASAEAGALAAAKAYVSAIAALDLATADKMTAPDERAPQKSDDPTDVTAALSRATDPITDPWVTPLGPGDQPGSYLFNGSYRIKGLTGGGTIALRQTASSDASKITNWTVVWPLIMTAPTFVDGDAIPSARVGNVEITGYESGTDYQQVMGYPGGYLLRPAKPRDDVEPLWFAIGADDLKPWNVDLPELKPRSKS